ncbi:MAG: hypothetical protein NTNFB01_27050 [Nitrospira sp.]
MEDERSLNEESFSSSKAGKLSVRILAPACWDDLAGSKNNAHKLPQVGSFLNEDLPGRAEKYV